MAFGSATNIDVTFLMFATEQTNKNVSGRLEVESKSTTPT